MELPVYMKEAEVCAVACLSRSTIRRMISRGEFPEPMQLSPGRVGWRREEVLEWLESRQRCRIGA